MVFLLEDVLVIAVCLTRFLLKGLVILALNDLKGVKNIQPSILETPVGIKDRAMW
jgi:hypothetical protein